MKPGYNYFHKGYRLPSNLCQEAVEDLQRTMVLTPEEREFVMARWKYISVCLHVFELKLSHLWTFQGGRGVFIQYYLKIQAGEAKRSYKNDA